MDGRGNIIVRSNLDGTDVYLYTHCSGWDLPRIVQTVLRRKARWNDASYLARMLFDEMTAGIHGGQTGFGISASRIDGGCDIMVDCMNHMVSIFGMSGAVSFDDYCEMPDPKDLAVCSARRPKRKIAEEKVAVDHTEITF